MTGESKPEEILSMSSDFGSVVATIEPEAKAGSITTEWTGPRCEKCDAPLKSDMVAICRSCGWYASLGTHVEVDPNWEIEPETNAPVAKAGQPSHLRVWLNLLPRWAWIIIASLLAVVLESVAVRLTTPAGSWARTAWSLGQLAIGTLLFAGCHMFNFLVAVADDSETGLLDLFLKPLKLWIRAAQNLPQRLWVANSAACGLTAAVMSLVVIGGIPYERLWDWGFKQPPKQNLMAAVMDRAKNLDNGQGADNLEDAITDFAGSQDVKSDGDPSKPEPPKPREKADCVILGYQTGHDGRLSSLLLGTAHLGELVYAGRVTPKMPEEELAALGQLLAEVQTGQPFLPIQGESAIWVQPKYTCRVSFGFRQKGRLRDVKWDTMLGSMDMP